jgi:serine/threonine protein kinase
MNARPTSHPTPEELAAFGLGKLDETAATAVARHLEACDTCSRAVKGVPPDSFVGLVRAAKNPVTRSPYPPVPAPEAASLSASRQRPSAARVPLALPPELAERYYIREELGHGGMGVVYLAEQRKMERLVAIKVLNKSLLDDPEALQRFRSEVKAAAQLEHVNIVRAYDAEQVGDLHLLVMEFVKGHSLAEVLKRLGTLPVYHSCHYIRQAAMGLQYAFKQGMVHRDIKPHNLMLASDGTIKILDFGLARLANNRVKDQALLAGNRLKDSSLTQANTFLGTPDYVAPEQADDARQADIRADIYSLGCTLYHLLVGRPPFREATVLDVILAHIEKEARPLHELCSEVPVELSRVVARMLAKDPSQRYQMPIEVAQALAPFCKREQKADPPASSSVPPGVRSPGRGTKIGTNISRFRSREPQPAPQVSAKPIAPPPSAAPAWRTEVKRWRMPAVAALLLGTGLLAGVVFKGKTSTGAVVQEIEPPVSKPEPLPLPGGWVALFNGKDLTGWTMSPNAYKGDSCWDCHRTPSPKILEVLPKKKEGKVIAYQGKLMQPDSAASIVGLMSSPLVPKSSLAGASWIPERVGKLKDGQVVPLWRVQNGAIVGTGPSSLLFSERDDYQNFHYRIEARINAKGNSGQVFRIRTDVRRGLAPAARYQAWISSRYEDPEKTGSLYSLIKVTNMLVQPNEWFTQEVIADGNHIIIKVNDKQTVDYVDEKNTYTHGHFALRQNHYGGELEVRKVEVKELPPNKLGVGL